MIPAVKFTVGSLLSFVRKARSAAGGEQDYSPEDAPGPACDCGLPDSEQSDDPPHRLDHSVTRAQLTSADAASLRPYVPVAATLDLRGASLLEGLRNKPAKLARLEELHHSQLLELTRAHDGIEGYFAIPFPCDGEVRSSVPTPETEEERRAQLAIFWGTHDPRPQPTLPRNRRPSTDQRTLTIEHEQLGYEERDVLSGDPPPGEALNRRLVILAPLERSGDQARTYRELWQGYEGVPKRRPPKRLPLGQLVVVALPGTSKASFSGSGYAVSGSLCDLPVPARNVRLVYLGYREGATTRAETGGFADLDDFAEHDLFASDEKQILKEGKPQQRGEAFAEALQSAYDYQEAVISLLLLPRERSAWDSGDRQTRTELFNEAYWRLNALTKVVPELADPAKEGEPEDGELLSAAITEKIRSSAGRIRCRPSRRS